MNLFDNPIVIEVFLGLKMTGLIFSNNSTQIGFLDSIDFVNSSNIKKIVFKFMMVGAEVYLILNIKNINIIRSFGNLIIT